MRMWHPLGALPSRTVPLPDSVDRRGSSACSPRRFGALTGSHMHDVAGIVANALSGSLRDVASSYRYLAALSSEERSAIVKGAQARREATESAIASVETEQAIGTMLTFQHAVRFVYATPDASSRRNFVQTLERLWSEEERRTVRYWRWSPPPLPAFLEQVTAQLQRVDFYERVGIANADIGGPELPKSGESIDDWMRRCRLTEEGWAWQYENRKRDERSRWFPSRRRLAAIEDAHAAHAQRSLDLRQALLADFHLVAAAAQRLATLKSDQLHQSVALTPLVEAADAIARGETLELVLLRAGVEAMKVREMLGDLR